RLRSLTSWQVFVGQPTLTYLTQMLSLTSQNFLSASTGMATLLVLTRGISRKTTEKIGNFWSDIVRMAGYILLPLSFLVATLHVSQGVIQSFSPYVEATTLENV